MNILFVPQNIASMPAITADSLNKNRNINAKCLTQAHKYQQNSNNTIIISGSKRNPIKWLWYKLNFKRRLKKWFDWADVIHYTWAPFYSDARDVEYAFSKGKKLFVEWVGSDIRNPDFLKTINPFYKVAFENGYEYASIESKAHSLRNQNLFAKYGVIPLLSPELSLFVDKSLFRSTHLLYQRVDVNNFKPSYPALNNNKPIIIHSPTAKIGKGSNIIISVIEDLKRQYDFDFILLHNMSRGKVLEIMQKADIFIDQIIVGSYGMAAMEAMSFGKPVMCYLMPEVFKAGLSEECPIVNANPDNLKEKLIELITNPQMRNDIGVKSRAFAEKFHNVEKISGQLLAIYKLELEKMHNAEIS
ncbi:MAG TPA: glycosyltransferase [Hanamia sp.]|nr:glycosyltransferase [Hanamia sp.]